MGKRLNIIIYILLGIIVILLLWKFFLYKDKDIVFNVEDNIEIKVGNNKAIVYELNEELEVTWKSEDNEIVKVSDGIMTGVNLGKTTIIGTVNYNDEAITKRINVSTYYGEKDIKLNNIIVPEGELFITKGDSYEIPINYEPNNAYITSIDYQVSDINIISHNGVLTAQDIGEANVNVIINNNVTKSIKVNVIKESTEPIFSYKVDDINIDEDIISLKVGEEKEIKYSVTPNNAFIRNTKWESSDTNVITVDDGIVKAKSSGEASIKLTVNDKVYKEINVVVSVPVTGIKLISNPKIVLKVGDQETIKTSIMPSNATNKKIKYTNTGGVSIDDNGVITGISATSGTITVTTVDGNYKQTISYVVNPQKGLVNNTGGIWGYTSPRDVTPTRADQAFFMNLVNNGKGTLSGNVYTYSDGKKTYKYDIGTSTLNVNGTDTFMRIYYPPNYDLSEVNTFTFMGGTGERYLSGYFSHLDTNREELSSSGIIILVSAKDNYYGYFATNATEFVKGIVNQKPGVKNAVGAYSLSGQAVGDAANTGLYDRLMIFNSYSKDVNKFKNIDVVIYSPVGDTMISATINSLGNLCTANYGKVTVVSNNERIYTNDRYQSHFLIVNPGRQMGSGHGYVNISKAKFFSYAVR